MNNQPKSFFLSPDTVTYLVTHSTPPDKLQRQLIEETQRTAGASAIMQITPEQGALLTMLCQIMGAERAVELGTFTGYSALCIARGLRENGHLLTCDINKEWTTIASRYWEAAGVSDKIEVRLAPAVQTLRSLPPDPVIDFAFMDADKPNYHVLYEELLMRLRTGGLIVIDNVLWGGRVTDPNANDEWTVAIRTFNDIVTADVRVDKVMLGVSDGVTIVRKR